MTTEQFAAAKSIARILDRCAARAESVNAAPASSKQCFFLGKLMAEAGEDGSEYLLDSSMVLTSRKASGLIDAYLNH